MSSAVVRKDVHCTDRAIWQRHQTPTSGRQKPGVEEAAHRQTPFGWQQLPPQGGEPQGNDVTTLGEYNPDVCHSPPVYDTPESSASVESMDNHGENMTPPESPAKRELPGTPPVNISGLSLNHDRRQAQNNAAGQYRRSMAGAGTARAYKRSASPELCGVVSHHTRPSKVAHAAGMRAPKMTTTPKSQNHHTAKLHHSRNAKQSRERYSEALRAGRPLKASRSGGDEKRCNPYLRDSAYESMYSQTNTCDAISSEQDTKIIPAGIKWPGLVLQPESSPISLEHLAVEVKKIYTSLTVVEAKCIQIDAAQAMEPQTPLDPDQWQALIALHRTLLYEHHDFLMATSHPSANEGLNQLATRHDMPARMWKHGIHAFLEVLRHRRPEAQDHMISFIYLAYQMMALLYETVPSFTDTWIECLGDLARYRMAIEDDPEPHAQWAVVAASWYSKSADRHPQIGRLPHHLGILERPSLRKFACYGKALTSVIPFPNAMASMRTLCEPIAVDKLRQKTGPIALEGNLCKLFSQMFLGAPEKDIQETFAIVSTLLAQPATFRWKDSGVSLAVIIVSALLGFGSPTNTLRYSYDVAISEKQRSSDPTSRGVPFYAHPPQQMTPEPTTRLLETAHNIALLTVHSALQVSTPDVLPFLHIMLGFFHSLSTLHSDLPAARNLLHGVRWNQVASFLNHTVPPVTPATEHSARARQYPQTAPLPEDSFIRGLVWAYFHFCPGQFVSDGGEGFGGNDEAAAAGAGSVRVVYWALRIALETEFLAFDPKSRTFAAPGDDNEGVTSVASKPITAPAKTATATTTTTSPRSSSDGDFVHVRRPAKQPPPPPVQHETWTTVAPKGRKAKKPRIEADQAQIVDVDW